MIKNIIYSTAICTTLAALPLSFTTTQAYATATVQAMPTRNPFQQGSGMARFYTLAQQIKRNKNLNDAQELLELLCTGGAYRIDDERNFVKVKPGEGRTIFGIRNTGPGKDEWNVILHGLHYASQVEGMDDYMDNLLESIQKQRRDVRIKAQTAGVFVLYVAVNEPFIRMSGMNELLKSNFNITINEKGLTNYLNRHGTTFQQYKKSWRPNSTGLTQQEERQMAALQNKINAFPNGSDATKLANNVKNIYENENAMIDKFIINDDDYDRYRQLSSNINNFENITFKMNNNIFTIQDKDLNTVLQYEELLSKKYSYIELFRNINEVIEECIPKRRAFQSALSQKNYKNLFNQHHHNHATVRKALTIAIQKTDSEKLVQSIFQLDGERKHLAIDRPTFIELIDYVDLARKILYFGSMIETDVFLQAYDAFGTLLQTLRTPLTDGQIKEINEFLLFRCHDVPIDMSNLKSLQGLFSDSRSQNAITKFAILLYPSLKLELKSEKIMNQ